MRSWCRAAFLPGEIDSIDIGVKAQATDGDGDVSTDGDGEGGLEEAKDWPRLRKLLDVDEKSRLFLDMPLGWQDFNCLLQWLCLIFRILESVFFTCMISRLIFAVLLETHVKRTRKSWGANQLLTLSTPRFEAAYSFLDATQSAVFQCFWFFDGFLVLPLLILCWFVVIWQSDSLFALLTELGTLLAKVFGNVAMPCWTCKIFSDDSLSKNSTMRQGARILWQNGC